MTISRPVSRAIAISFTFLMLCGWTASAEDQFGVREMAQEAGIGGYNTYHDHFRSRGERSHHDYNPQPVLNGRLYQDRQGLESGAETVNRQNDHDDQPTRLEEFYRERSGDKNLNQFGYNLFYQPDKKQKIDIDGDEIKSVSDAPMGVVQDDYIVQVGDEISVIFSGERRGRAIYKIGSDGRLLIDNLPPIQATGKTFGALKLHAQSILTNAGYRGRMDLSIEGIRQIGVLVAGHVKRPGRHNLSAFHSIIDVLHMAGGIQKTGSLRQVKLIRHGQTKTIDLYGFITSGQLPDRLQLSDGDRIIVPPIGPTIAVVGDVKQAGIYELHSDPRMAWRYLGGNRAHKITLDEALSMAGGVLGAGDNQFTLQNASSKIINLNNKNQKVIEDSSILTVIRASDVMSNAVTLEGYSRKNGVYDLSSAPTLQKLLTKNNAFGVDIYPLIGVISRTNRQSLTRTMMGFSPQLIAMGKDDRQLESGDVVYLFSNDDIETIKNEDDKKTSLRGDEKESEFPKLVRDYVRDNMVVIQGAVRDTGSWPVGSVTDLKTLVSVAGGLTTKADTQNIEIVSRGDNGNHDRQTVNVSETPMTSVSLYAGDQVRINKKFETAISQNVRITGEVKNPGTYDLMRGDTLLSLIQRAGGLTDQAYPPATVFSREAERKREEQKFRAAAQELERTVSVNLNTTDKDASLTPAQISMARDLAEDLRSVKAVGRITVEADPTILKARPDLNLLLEGGDRIHIPKRNLTVRVSGEVMNSASLLFEDGKDIQDYIREAGGMTYYADKARIFVLYPDGSSQPLRSDAWRTSKPAMAIPGSTIIVPRDPKPFDFVDSFKDITQILTNMAITTVFVDDVVSD
jgi:protein involved in polysaccharide export with SLBB domain